MKQNEKAVEVLNDLILINNDRVAGYEKAIDETKDIDVDLKAVFTKMANDSREFVSELSTEISRLGGEVATGTTNSGKIYRIWMDIKATFTGKDRLAVLQNCEFGEDAAQKAYNEALNNTDVELDANVRQLITNQKATLRTAHDLIKKYRDMHASVKEKA